MPTDSKFSPLKIEEQNNLIKLPPVVDSNYDFGMFNADSVHNGIYLLYII